MTENTQAELWRRLFEAAVRIRDMAPWGWMLEGDLLGIEDPESGQAGYASVMGAQGEHFAVSLYLGPEGLSGFCALQEAEEEGLSPESILEVPQLQVSFEDREELHAEDRNIIKALGLRFRGRNAWPMFRSYRPGMLPWHLEDDEARFLTVALEQLAEVAPRAKEDESLLWPGESGCLTRVLRGEGERRCWVEEVIQPPEPEPVLFAVQIPKKTLDRVRKAKASGVLEADFFLLPTPIHEGEARPFFPYALLLVDGATGMVVAVDQLDPRPSLDELFGRVAPALLNRLDRAGLRPQELRTGSERLCAMLEPLAEKMDLDLVLTDDLPALEAAKESLISFLEQGPPEH